MHWNKPRNPVVRNNRRSGQTMIGLLVTVAIIIAAAAFYLSAKGKNPDGSESSKTALKRSMDLAEEVALQNNINQIQMIIGMYKGDNEGKVPASLEELKATAKFPAEMWINPVDKKPLGYDPATGRIIVTPYEGMSPAIAKMTANPMHGADVPLAPGTNPNAPAAAPAPATPGMPQIPTIPNSGNVPMEDVQ